MRGHAGVALVAATILSSSPPALANGVNTHVWIALTARDQLPAGPLKTLLTEQENAFMNGAFFPDGGYAVGHPFGETAHWEPLINAYLEWIRDHYDPPFADAEAARHVAFLMGMVAHSIGDQTFDPLFLAAARGYDAAGWSDELLDSLDTASDVFLVDQTGVFVDPEVDVPSVELAVVFASIGEPVDPATLDNAQDLMRRAVLAYAQATAMDADKVAEYEARYPWAAAHFMDDDTPGSPTGEARAVSAALQSVWWRLHRQFSAANLIVSTYPADGRRGHPTDHTLVEAQLLVVFGWGIDPATATEARFEVKDDSGKLYDVDVNPWSGAHPNSIQLVPREDWAADQSFTVTILPGLVTVDGRTLDEPIGFGFSTAAAGADEPAPLGDPTPQTEEPEAPEPVDPGGGGGGGCSAAAGAASAGGGGAWLLGLLLALPPLLRRRGMATLALLCGFAAACQGPPDSLAADATPAPIEHDADVTTDAGPPPTGIAPALVLDDVHIASLTEQAHAFSLLGMLVNPQLESAIAGGQLRLGVMLHDLDDPSGQADDTDLAVGLLTLTDSDGDPADDFDPAAPETFTPTAGALGMDGRPSLSFTDATIVAGALDATGLDAFMLGGLPLPLSQVSLSGDLVAGNDAGGAHIARLDDGRLIGGVPISLIALAPNLASMQCAGATLLDVIATGCGFIAVQPDVDLDGDGLEKLHDSDGDGSIDRCVDGDGTEILGASCPTDSRMADGYRLILVVSGVRATVASQ